MKNYFQRLAAAAVRGALKEADKMVADAEKAIVDEFGSDTICKVCGKPVPRETICNQCGTYAGAPWCKICQTYHRYPSSNDCIERKGKP